MSDQENRLSSAVEPDQQVRHLAAILAVVTNLGAISTRVAGEVRRRRPQTVALAIIPLLASSTGTMALTLLGENKRALDDAFAAPKET